jgi:hypothetical protein
MPVVLAMISAQVLHVYAVLLIGNTLISVVADGV